MLTEVGAVLGLIYTCRFLQKSFVHVKHVGDLIKLGL